MATWAYSCRPCAGPGEWFVAVALVDEMPASVTVLRVQGPSGWADAVVDRGHRVAVDGSLLRAAVAAEPAEDARAAAGSAQTMPERVEPAVTASSNAHGGAQVHAAAISLQGHRFVVVLTGLEVVRSPGEAQMLAADLRPHFGGVDLVLMGQSDDGTPYYHGAPALLALLADLPIDRMPWRAYTVG